MTSGQKAALERTEAALMTARRLLANVEFALGEAQTAMSDLAMLERVSDPTCECGSAACSHDEETGAIIVAI